MIKKTIIVIIICLVPVLLWADEEIPVKVKADNLRYLNDPQKIIATGRVVAEYKNYVIHAEQLVVDVENNVIVASGNIKLSQDDYEVEGFRFTFFL